MTDEGLTDDDFAPIAPDDVKWYDKWGRWHYSVPGKLIPSCLVGEPGRWTIDAQGQLIRLDDPESREITWAEPPPPEYESKLVDDGTVEWRDKWGLTHRDRPGASIPSALAGDGGPWVVGPAGGLIKAG